MKEEDDEDEGEDEGEGGGGVAVPTERAGWDGTVIHGPSALETSAEDAHPDEGEEERAGELLSVRRQLMTASMPDMSPRHIGSGDKRDRLVPRRERGGSGEGGGR